MALGALGAVPGGSDLGEGAQLILPMLPSSPSPGATGRHLCGGPPAARCAHGAALCCALSRLQGTRDVLLSTEVCFVHRIAPHRCLHHRGKGLLPQKACITRLCHAACHGYRVELYMPRVVALHAHACVCVSLGPIFLPACVCVLCFVHSLSGGVLNG